MGFFVVKNKYGKWSKVFEWMDEGIGIKTVRVIRGLNDNDIRLLVGNMINSKGPSEYYLFNFKENWDGSYVDLGTWSELSIVQSINGSINFVVENREESMISDLYSIRYDGDRFSYNGSSDIYQSKINEYKTMIDEYEGNESAWYYYIYAKLMAGRYEEALKNLNEYLERDKSRDSIKISEVKFQVLKAMILSKLDRYKEAQEIIDIYKGLFNDTEILFANDVKAYEFYYVAGVVSKGLKDEKMADYNFNKALEMLEKTYDKKITGYQEIISEVIESLIEDQ